MGHNTAGNTAGSDRWGDEEACAVWSELEDLSAEDGEMRTGIFIEVSMKVSSSDPGDP